MPLAPLRAALVSALALGIASLSIGTGGCRGATEIDVEVSTDMPCPSTEQVGIAMVPLGSLAALDSTPFSSTRSCGGTTTVGSLFVTPSGDKDAELALRVVLGVDVATESCTVADGYKGCIVARRSLRYIPQSDIQLPVTLYADCVNVPCDESSTCVAGQCVTSTLDPTKCPDLVCGESQLGNASDAGPPDATIADGGDASDASDATQPPTDGTVDALPGCAAPCVASFAPSVMHTCAVTSQGGVECWGDDMFYELGRDVDGGQDPTPTGVPDESAVPFTTAIGVTSGGLNACATLPGGTVQCWGNSTEGEFGAATNLQSASTIAPFANAHELSFEYNDSCWRDATDEVHCMGSAYQGALANGDTSMTDVTTPFDVGFAASQLATGPRGACALRSSDSVWLCWGSNMYGALDPSMAGVAAFSTPTDVHVPSGTTSLALGAKSTCAIVGGNAVCWGGDDQAQAGVNPAMSNPVLPTTVMTSSGPLANVTQITVADDPIESTEFHAHACALVMGGDVYCWGDNTYGQLGRGPETAGTPATDGTAAKVQGLPSMSRVLAGAHHTCASATGGALYCWGRNSDGQVGDTDLTPHSAVFLVPL